MCCGPVVRVRVRLGITFLDLAVEVDGVHAGRDDARVAVSGAHDARHLVHQLHGHTCRAAHSMVVSGKFFSDLNRNPLCIERCVT